MDSSALSEPLNGLAVCLTSDPASEPLRLSLGRLLTKLGSAAAPRSDRPDLAIHLADRKTADPEVRVPRPWRHNLALGQSIAAEMGLQCERVFRLASNVPTVEIVAAAPGSERPIAAGILRWFLTREPSRLLEPLTPTVSDATGPTSSPSTAYAVNGSGGSAPPVTSEAGPSSLDDTSPDGAAVAGVDADATRDQRLPRATETASHPAIGVRCAAASDRDRDNEETAGTGPDTSTAPDFPMEPARHDPDAEALPNADPKVPPPGRPVSSDEEENLPAATVPLGFGLGPWAHRPVPPVIPSHSARRTPAGPPSPASPPLAPRRVIQGGVRAVVRVRPKRP
jgi:hypothetical protein